MTSVIGCSVSRFSSFPRVLILLTALFSAPAVSYAFIFSSDGLRVAKDDVKGEFQLFISY